MSRCVSRSLKTSAAGEVVVSESLTSTTSALHSNDAMLAHTNMQPAKTSELRAHPPNGRAMTRGVEPMT